MPALIIWGFIYHYITFTVIPVIDVIYLVFGYLALATLTIVFTHVYDMGKITPWLRYIRLFAPLLLQFAIGSMIGGVFIFYWFSGSIFVSWPFIVFVIVLIIGLELYKHYLENPIVQFGLYNFATFLLLAVALPIFFTSVDPGWFMLAGWLSLVMVLLLTLLLRKSPTITARRYKILTASILIFVVMNVFYFSNLIPPVPLSIRDAGVYHNVYRSGGGYVVEAEPQTFWQRFSLSPAVHLVSGQPLYVFTSIYSPTDLDTDIVHEWEYYDATKNQWVSVSKVSFHVIGGRVQGYRGYSLKTQLNPGKWRVYTETPRGQVLGRVDFRVEQVTEPPTLVQEIK